MAVSYASFSSRITVYFGALLLAVMVILFSLWYFGLPPLGIVGAGDMRLAQAMRSLEARADLHRNLIANGIQDRRGDLLVVAEDAGLTAQLAQRDSGLQKNLLQVFERLQRAYPDRFQQLRIVDPVSLRVLASSVASELGRQFDDGALIQRAIKPGTTELLKQQSGSDGAPGLLIVRQMHGRDADGPLVGVLVGFVDLQQFVASGFQDDRAGLEGRSSALLLDPAGQVLAHFTSGQNAGLDFQLNRRVAFGFEGSLFQPDANGEPVLTVYRHLQLSGTQAWTLVHYAGKQEALIGQSKKASRLGLAALLLTLIGLLLIRWAARFLTQPLLSLAQAAGQLGAGDLSTRALLPPAVSREFAALGDAFNCMAGKVQKAQATLEAQVRLRTAELQGAEARYSALFEASADAVMVLDDCVVIDCNPAALRMFGASRRESLIGQRPSDLSPPSQPDGMDLQVAATQRAEQARLQGSVAFEWLHQRIDNGATFMTEVVLCRVDVDGQPLMQATVRDISARKLAEAQLRESEESLSITLLSIGDAVIATDAQGLVTRMNPAAERLTGWPLADARGMALPEVFKIVNALTRLPAINPIQQVMAHGEVVGLAHHTTLVARDGREYQISDSAAPIRDPAGQIVGMVLVFSDVTEAYRAREALAINAEMLERTGEMAKVGGWELDLRSGKFIFSREALRINDIEPGSEPGMKPGMKPNMEAGFALYAPRERQLIQDAVELAMQDGTPWDLELVKRTTTGRLIWVRTQGSAVIEAGRVVRLCGAYHDITERKLAEAELRIAATAFESQEGIMVADADWRIMRVNKAFTRITGYSAAEAMGQLPAELLGSGRQEAGGYAALTRAVMNDGVWQGEVWDKRKNGEVFPVGLNISAVKGPGGEVSHFVTSMTDITLRKAAEEQIQSLAYYDPLTQLPNRRLLLDRLDKALATAVRYRRNGALLFVDLDDFKTLNDTLGHEQGDLLLTQVAQRLNTCIRGSDTVARFGGDEFVVLLENLSEDRPAAASQAEAVGEKILVALNQTYRLGSQEQHSTPSIGITLFGEQPEGIDEPLKRADMAMYQAKAAGRNMLRFFDPHMQEVVSARAAMEVALRAALAQGQFMLHYQAQVLDGSQIIGAEVLLRWQHPQRGMVSPAEFIPVAEESGLILPLGRWVLEAACRQLAFWAAHSEFSHLTVAVNVSARQVREADFVQQVLTVLKRTGADPRLLKLELTEGMLVANVEDVIAKMMTLKAAGVGFSLDDFGTGYSSLSYLKRLPLDQLKIDQTFVRDILVDANDAAIARMVIVLAESLGLAVIAEGVETEAQRSFLAAQGCHAYQGYLFSRPLPLADFEALALTQQA